MQILNSHIKSQKSKVANYFYSARKWGKYQWKIRIFVTSGYHYCLAEVIVVIGVATQRYLSINIYLYSLLKCFVFDTVFEIPLILP